MTVSPQFAAEADASGRFVRQPNAFTGRIVDDPQAPYPVEPGRYQLYASLACPWAQRSLIDRELLGLTDAIGLTVVDPIRDERGWRFTLSAGDRDPVSGAEFLCDLYRDSQPDFDGRCTVPAIWDTRTRRLVTNDYPQISLDLVTEWTAYQREGAPQLYPVPLREEIDEVDDRVFHTVNNGVYKAGFATAQAPYEDAVTALFDSLDWLERRLAGRRFLVGEQLTEADVRLWTTLARFDAVYVTHFRCNVRRLVDYPRLWDYARALYTLPAFRDTTDFDHIKQHYYCTHHALNPSGIVPVGFAVDWDEPSERAAALD